MNRIQGGEAWEAVLDNALVKANILIALIGPNWLGPKEDEPGAYRINDENDMVRAEVARALNHPSHAVLPLLIDDTPPPAVSLLPENLRALAGIQALPLRSNSWDQDLRSICDALIARFGVRLKRTQHVLPEPSKLKTYHAIVADEVLDDMAKNGLLPGWSVETVYDFLKTGAVREFLKKTYQFETDTNAFNFLKAISEVVAKRNHHPVIEAVYRDVTLKLSTFDKGMFITMNDVDFAGDIDKVAARWPYETK